MHKNQIKTLACIIFLTAFFSQVFGQTLKPCGSDEYRANAILQDPSILQRSEEFERKFQEYLQNNLSALSSSKTTESSWGLRTIYTIPCVVHVVHDGDPKTPDDSISIEQVQSQFDAFFENFRRVPYTLGYGSGVDMQIEFALATKDPDGKPTTGVTYEIAKDLLDLDKDKEDSKLKALGAWNRKKYLNIWTVNSISSSGSKGDILGYAQFPDMPDPTDGIVVRSYVFGTVGTVGQNTDTKRYTKGRTATHEAGHWLNLLHPFTDGCSESNCQGGGDKLCDTPPTKEENFGFGDERQNTCTKDRPDLPDNPHNYMDYLNDLGLNYFSPMQKARSTFALKNPTFPQRNAIWKDDNLKETGTGPYGLVKANFVSPNLTTCVGGAVKMIDYSMGSPNKFEWEFPGGTPSKSTDIQPTVTYSKAGSYTIKLKVTNISGNTSTIEKKDYIKVTDKIANIPYGYDFSDPNLPEGWTIRDYDEANPRISQKWELVKEGKYMRMRCAKYSDYKQVDDIITPSLNFSNADKPVLNFRYSYTPTRTAGAGSLLYTDTLEISASDDCGANWSLVYKKGGQELASTDVKEVENEIGDPLSNQWNSDLGCLKYFAKKPNVQIRFRIINGFGNNFFLDDVTVENNPAINCWPVSNDNIASLTTPDVKITPNPTTDKINIQFGLSSPQPVKIEIFDMQGRKCAEQMIGLMDSGEHQIMLPNKLSPGIYSIKININNKISTQNIIVE